MKKKSARGLVGEMAGDMDGGRLGACDGLAEEDGGVCGRLRLLRPRRVHGGDARFSYCRARKQPHPFATLPHPHAHEMFDVMPRRPRPGDPALIIISLKSQDGGDCWFIHKIIGSALLAGSIPELRLLGKILLQSCYVGS
jgi:hypothetical protein